MKIEKLADLLKIKGNKPMKLVVVACHDEEVIYAVNKAKELGIITPILIGDKNKTLEIFKINDIDIDGYQIINEKDLTNAAEIGVKMLSSGEANFIMKGLIDTSILLKAVLNKEWGLRTDSLISHVMIYEIPSYNKLIYLTDGGMNLQPNLDDKVKIIENAALVAKSMGKEIIKVAAIAAKEKVNPKMLATVEADLLKKKYKNGEFSDGIIVDGPLAFDLAISKQAAEIKGYKSDVAGDADVILVPNIEMGNGIGKSITYFAKAKSAGIVMGAKLPIVLTSRADNSEDKLYSIALGSVVANHLFKKITKKY